MMIENLSTNTILDAVASPLLICQNNTILYANPAAEKLTGYACDQLLNSDIEGYIYRTSGKAFSTWYSESLADRTTESLDVRLYTANKSLVWVKLTVSGTLFEGKPVRLLTMQDITHLRNIETQLYLSETYRDLLLMNNPDLVMMTDNAGNLLYVSPSIYETLGYSADEVLGQNWIEKVYPDDQALIFAAAQEVRQTDKSARLEVRIRNQAGEYLWFEGLVGMVSQRQNDQITLISSVRNIHKHKLNELALIERERRLRLITDNMQDIVLEIDPLGLIRYLSPSCLSIMGYQQEDLLGSSHLDYVHPDDTPQVLEYFSQAYINPERKPLEFRFKHKDGHYLWIEIVYKLVMDEAGTLQSVVISAREITERKQVQEAFQQNRHLLQQIMDTAPSGIYLFDVPSGQSLFHNQRGILGYSEDVVKQGGENFYLNLTHPDDKAAAEANNQRLRQAQDGEVIVSECRIQHADGEWRWHQFHDTVFARDEKGIPKQYLRAGYEITERKLAEEALHQNQYMLQQITDVAPVGIFIYDVKKRRAIYHNKKSAADTGIETVEDTLPGKFYADYVHPDDVERHLHHQEHLMQAKDGEIVESENRIRLPDGSYRWFNFRDVVFKRDEEGKPSQFLGSMQDVTERKQADEALNKSQNLLQKITDTAPFGIYIYDVQQGRDIYHNKRHIRDIKSPPDPNTSEANFYANRVHPDDLNVHAEHRQRLMSAQDGEIIESEVRALNRQGKYEWLYFRDIVFARDEEGKPSQFLGSMQNITERKEAEQALRENQNLLKQITDTIPLDIYIYDVDLKHNVFFNRAQNMGYSVNTLDNQFTGDYYINLVHPDDIDKNPEHVKRLMSARDGELVHGEYRMKHADGEWHWYEFRDIVFTRRADGTPRQFLGSLQDITQRKKTEAALQESRRMFQQVTETVPMQIFIYDYDLQRNVFENRPSDLGFDDQIIRNAPLSFFTNLIHPEDRAAYDETMTKLLAAKDGDMLENEFRMQSANGTYAWRNYRYTPFGRRADGTLSQFLGMIQNVDERKNAAEALRENEEKLRLVTDNIHDLVALTDENMVYRYVTPSHFKILGYQSEELIGKSIFDLLHPDDLEMVKVKVSAAIERQIPDTAEFRYRHHDGYYLWMETNGSLALDKDGEFNGAVFASRDVSERRWMQRAMLEQEKLLVMLQKEQELSALKTRMMSRLSHELRTPLAIISTSADLLDTYGKRMTEIQRAERLQQIKTQIKHFISMLDNMALVVKGISYSIDFSPAPYNLELTAKTVIKELKDLLHVTHLVELELQGDMHEVNSDEQLIRLILTHLLANALKYSPPTKPILVRAKLSDETISIEVRDQGMGILPQDKDRIFEPFFRGTNIGEVPGLGVGLSIVKDAVESMNGKVEVNSEMGKGTTVLVEIPLGGIIGIN